MSTPFEKNALGESAKPWPEGSGRRRNKKRFSAASKFFDIENNPKAANALGLFYIIYSSSVFDFLNQTSTDNSDIKIL